MFCFALVVVNLALASARFHQPVSARSQKTSSEISMKHDGGTNFPHVSDALKEPDRIFRGLSERFHDIGSSVEAMHQGKLDTLAKQEADYNEKLSQQDKMIKSLLQNNARTERDIVTSNHRNSLLRKRAVGLAEDCTLLSEELTFLRGNISLAQDFIVASLASTAGASKSRELSILRQLSDQDSDRKSKKRKQERFNKIMERGRTKSDAQGGGHSLLQVTTGHRVRSLSPNEASRPEDVIRHLQDSVEELSRQHDHSSAELRHAFKSEFKNGTETFSHLSKEQDKLLEALKSSQELGSRLTDAVKHLTSTRIYVTSGIRSLKTYLNQLGEEPNSVKEQLRSEMLGPVAGFDKSDEAAEDEGDGQVSLLQFDEQSSTRTLSGYRRLVTQPLSDGPTQIFKSISEDVSLLDNQIRAMEQDRVGHLVDKQLDYEAELRTQSRENYRLASKNHQTSAAIHGLATEIHMLRQRAQDLKDADNAMRLVLKTLQLNLTMSSEYASKTLAAASLKHAAKVKVLTELDHKDIVESELRGSEKQMKEVESPDYLEEELGEESADGRMSLLELRAKSFSASLLRGKPTGQTMQPPADDEANAADTLQSLQLRPADVLADMHQEFQHLNQAHAGSEKTLEKHYSKAVAKNDRLHNALEREETSAGTTLASANHTKEELVDAVQFLTRMENYLQERTHAVKAFLVRIARTGVEAQVITEMQAGSSSEKTLKRPVKHEQPLPATGSAV